MSWRFFKPNGTFIDKDEQEDTRPSGLIMMHGGLTVPDGFLRCDGVAYPISVYQALYDCIGTKFNTGAEPPSYFSVPDFTFGTFPIGAGNSIGPGSSGGTHAHSHSGALHSHAAPSTHDHGFPSHQHGVSHTHPTAPHRHSAGSYTLKAEADNGPGNADSGTTIDLANQTIGNVHSHDVNGVTAYANPALIFNQPAAALSGQAGGGTVQATGPGINPATVTVDSDQGSLRNHLPPYLPIYFIIKT